MSAYLHVGPQKIITELSNEVVNLGNDLLCIEMKRMLSLWQNSCFINNHLLMHSQLLKPLENCKLFSGAPLIDKF